MPASSIKTLRDLFDSRIDRAIVEEKKRKGDGGLIIHTDPFIATGFHPAGVKRKAKERRWTREREKKVIDAKEGNTLSNIKVQGLDTLTGEPDSRVWGLSFHTSVYAIQQYTRTLISRRSNVFIYGRSLHQVGSSFYRHDLSSVAA